MEEIIKIFNKNRKKWEHYLYGYITKLNPYTTKEDIYQDVLVSLFEKYNQNKIDMSNVENYMFLTYRNHIYRLCNKWEFKNIKSDEIQDIIYYGDDYIEVFDVDETMIPQIKKILGEVGYNIIIEYFSKKKGIRTSKVNKPEDYDYTEQDIKKIWYMKNKIKDFFKKSKKN